MKQYRCQYHESCSIKLNYSKLCYDKRRLPIEECPRHCEREAHEIGRTPISKLLKFILERR